VLETDLHLLYLLTPHLKNLREPNWQAFKQLFSRLSNSELRVAEMYGIEPTYMDWAMTIKP